MIALNPFLNNVKYTSHYIDRDCNEKNDTGPKLCQY